MTWLCVALLISVLVAVRANLMDNYLKAHPKPAEMGAKEYEFDWIAYVNDYSDLAGSNLDAASAWQHYHAFGEKEKRTYTSRFPELHSTNKAEIQLMGFTSELQKRSVALADRTLVMYTVPALPDTTSHIALANTLKIFLSAVVSDTSASSTNFYIFNMLHNSPADHENPLTVYIPDQPNIATLRWNGKVEQTLLLTRAMDFLHGAGATVSFGSFFFGDAHSRGPLAQAAHGQWLKQYRTLLTSNNVGLVGASFSCELIPHVQNHAWAISQELVPTLLQAYKPDNYRRWKGAVRYNMQYFSALVMKKHNVSSVLYRNTLGEDFYQGNCMASKFDPQYGRHQIVSKDPLYWCNLNIQDMMFLPWNAQVFLRMCENTKQSMYSFLHSFRQQAAHLQLISPESVHGGPMHDLTKQFSGEMLRAVESTKNAHGHPNNIDAAGTLLAPHQACLLVRSSYVHSTERNISIMDEDYFSGFDNLAQSLLRQTDGNWVAYFFLTDDHPFGTKLRKILDAFRDTRFQYLPIPKHFRLPYTSVDAGYTATDVALKKVLGIPQCGVVSFTNADNIYGTDIIRRVRSVQTHVTGAPKLILTPLDSRNFIYQDLMGRNGGAVGFQSVCTALLVAMEVNTLGLAVQPRPVLGKIDLAGAFFDREQLVKEQLFFSNFTNPAKYTCLGCQDGYFTEYLVQSRHWQYTQLAVDGLQSLVFHGPSPIWCMASGRVWFGHPSVNKARCFTQAITSKLRHKDSSENGQDTNFDWGFHDATKQVCLQYTKKGNDLYQAAVPTK